MLSEQNVKVTMGQTEQTQPTYKEKTEEGHKDVSMVKGQGKGDSVCCWYQAGDSPGFPSDTGHPHPHLQLSPPGRRRQELHASSHC